MKLRERRTTKCGNLLKYRRMLNKLCTGIQMEEPLTGVRYAGQCDISYYGEVQDDELSDQLM